MREANTTNGAGEELLPEAENEALYRDLAQSVGRAAMTSEMDSEARAPHGTVPEIDVYERYRHSDEIPFGD